jgi:citrate synthase
MEGFCLENIKIQSTYLNFAKQIEELTLEKKPNLILNVDGYIAAILLDLLTAE